MTTRGWRIPVDPETYFLHQKKEAEEDRRRPTGGWTKVGPGVRPNAVRLDDLNNPLATYDGFFSCEAGADNAPTSDEPFVGVVVSDAHLGGRQTFTGLETGYNYQRVFLRHPQDPEYIIYTDWTSDEPEPEPPFYWSRFIRTTDQTITAGGSYIVPWEIRQTEDGYTALDYLGTNVTIAKSGLYILNGLADIAPTASAQRAAVRLRKNGVTIPGAVALQVLNSGNTGGLQVSQTIPLAAGDLISVETNSYAANGILANMTLTISGPLAPAG